MARREPEQAAPLPAAAPAPAELTVDELVAQVELIQEAMKRVMRDGEHYGVIPGTQKPTLLKPGAEKLTRLFQLAPEYEEAGSVHQKGFIAYRIRCVLTHIPSGRKVGEGMGSCNSRERKYASQDAWNIDNTLLKMACKRALVAAVLVATAASDIFTQDREDSAPVRSSSGEADKPVLKSQHSKLAVVLQKLEETVPREDGKSWEDRSREFAKELFGKDSRADLTRGEMSMLIEAVQDDGVPF